MSKVSILLKNALVVALILGIGLAAFPATRVFAAGLNDPSNPPGDHPKVDALLEKIWAREQTLYQRQNDRLAKADEFFARVQSGIDKATAKGYDASGVQAALDASRPLWMQPGRSTRTLPASSPPTPASTPMAR